MGVPAFFKWISSRYPLIMQKIFEDTEQMNSVCHVMDEHGGVIPQQVDNLYLDCNGIVHPCCHPEGGAKQPENEEEMFTNIHALIDRLFNLTQPKNLLYLALDGVAPRAKMNQQRARRFCSAREFEEQEQAMREVGITPDRESWDHNQITPGTPFMARLAKSLRSYVAERQGPGGDPRWREVVVIIDDSSNPGEGEHKIMEYIRRWRHSQNYSPDACHAICGQDADLIHLGLALHEPKVLILRDRVEFQKKHQTKRKEKTINPNSNVHDGAVNSNEMDLVPHKEMDFLNIERLRQYLFFDFYKAFQTEEMLYMQRLNPTFVFDIEKIIDDFIFICFFVGNDFLPHLPSLSIRDGSLDLLLEIYRLILPQLNGYINNEGIIDLARVELLVSKFSLLETQILQKKMREEASSAKRDKYKAHAESVKNQHQQLSTTSSSENGAAAGVETNDEKSQEELKLMLEKLILDNNEKLVEASAANNQPIDMDRPNYKFQYYKQKILDDEPPLPTSATAESGGGGGPLGSDPASVDRMTNLVRGMKEEYMKGLCWVALYYAQKVPSWTWYYPYHYAPFASDLNGLMSLHPMQFHLGEPFSPLTQLMAVLPARSSHCVPAAYRPLMESSSSPLASNYHLDFKLDPNNKPISMRWLWVAKIDFMNTKLLVEELAKIQSNLSKEETIRNSFHDIEIFFPASYRVSCKEDNQEWCALIGGSIEGLISSDSSTPEQSSSVEQEERGQVSTSRSSSSSKYKYKLAPFQKNRSMIDRVFFTRAPPIMWPVLQASLPRRPVRLPVNHEQLAYIVLTHGGAVDNGNMSAAASHYRGAGYIQGGGGGGGYAQGRGGYAQGGGGKGGRGDNVCWYFNSPNGCNYGANCRFAHVSST